VTPREAMAGRKSHFGLSILAAINSNLVVL